MGHLRPLFFAAGTFVVVLAAGGAFITLAERRHADEHGHLAREIGAARAHLLERQFARSLASTFALASILRQSGRIDNFDTLAADIIESHGGISSLQLAPDGVVTQIYPLAGNEAAIGHDLLNDPERRTEALKAIESRTLTLAGPFDLIQGGSAVIGRLPVFVADKAGGERFWGFTIALIRLPALLEIIDLGRLVERGYDYELWRIDPDSGTPVVFARSAGADLKDVIPFEIDVPNGKWTLAIAPRGGWPTSSALPLEIVFVVLAGTAVAFLTYNLVRQPVILRRDIALRTRDLVEANRDLEAEIAERKRAEDALHKNEVRFRRVLEAAPDGMTLVRGDGTIAFANEQMEQLFGYRHEELIGEDIDMLVPERFRGKHARDRVDYFSQPRIRPMGSSLDLYGRRKDGSEFPVEISLSPLETMEGFFVCGTVRDVTERKRAQEALQESEERYRIVAETANDVIITIDESSRIVYANPATEKAFGYAVQELLGQSLTVLMPDSLRFRHVAALKKFIDTGERSVSWEGLELTGLHRSGREFYIEVSFGAMRQADGTYLFTGIVRDVSERKRAEEALRESEAALRKNQKDLQDLAGKLLTAQEAERRRLAREMHDDLTQRLAVLAIEAGKLERKLKSSGGEMAEQLRHMKEHMMKLATDVHAISRQLHPSILDDLGLVDAMDAECTSFSEREGIIVTYEPKNVPEGIPKEVALCLYRITQEGLRNIAKHAHTPEARVSLIGKDGMILLHVEDSGIGFDSAKIRGERGLGLASMEERARLIQADLCVDSQPGKGTMIEVRVPLGRTQG